MSIGPVRQLLRIALLALVLGAQVIAHAHAADHHAPTGKTQCPICAVAQPNGHAAIDQPGAVADPAPQLPQFAEFTPPAGAAAIQAVRARAPPKPC